MKKTIMVKESLYEFAKRGRPKKRNIKPVPGLRGIDATDTWREDTDDEEMIDPSEFNIDTSDMETAEEIEVEDEDIFDDKLFRALNNEIKVIEPNRRTLIFTLKGDLENTLYGVPMAKMGDNAFLFKLKDGKLKKIYLKDIVLESERSDDRAKMVFEKIGWPEELREYPHNEDEFYDEDDDVPHPGELIQDDYDEEEYFFDDEI